MESVESQLQKLKLLERKLELKEGLPHLYGLKMYQWQRDYFFERNLKAWFITAANQCGKSSIQIRKFIDIATDSSCWKTMWPDRVNDFPDFHPVIWYLYPNQDTVKQEVHEKWIPEFLPRGKFKDHPIYGWKLIVENRVIKGIRFNLGVTIYFKTYSQNVEDLQAGSVALIGCFTKGNYTYTDKGIKDISEVVVGDMLMTRTGFKRVYRTFKHDAETISSITNAGVSICGTPDHPFILHNEIKRFDKLDKNDALWTVPTWRLLCAIWQTKRLSYLKEYFTIVIRNLKTLGTETILEEQGRLSMLRYGNLIIAGKFLMIASYIIRILFHLTIGLKTSSYSQGQSTQGFTSYKSGNQKSSKTLNVQNVAKSFCQGLLRIVHLDTALQNVAGQLSNLTACIVEKRKKLDQMLERCTVRQAVQTKQTVYNVSVEEDHEYYINGILVHNCDEELPEPLYPELRARLMATQGYFSMVFTATIGQEFWRLTIQPDLGEPINFPNAFKRQVSLYDSKFYYDGTPSSWTDARIQNEIESCKNKQEVDRRIFGKFVKTDNKKYYAFDAERHYIPFPQKDGKEYRGVPAGYTVYSAVDCGAGGEKNHPAAFIFLYVNKDYTKIRAFRGRRLDKIETTAGDIYEAYKKSRGLLTIEKQSYDWASKDFDTITTRAGDKFYKANKGHKDGEDLLNTLFKYDILKIYQDVELQKLKSELDNLDNDTNKRRAKDDMVDVLRYAVMSIPVDWEVILKNVKDTVVSITETSSNEERELRPRDFDMNKRLLESGGEDDFEEWNELY